MAKNFIKSLTVTTVDAAAITAGTWVDFFAGGTTEACFMIRITNTSDTNVLISFDGGITAHEMVPSGEAVDLNLQANSSPTNFVSLLRKGTVISVRGTAGTGLIYLSGYYNEQF